MLLALASLASAADWLVIDGGRAGWSGWLAVGTAVGVARAATGLPGGAAGGAPGPAAWQPASRRKTTSGKATAFGQVNDRPIRLRIAGKLS